MSLTKPQRKRETPLLEGRERCPNRNDSAERGGGERP